MDMDGHPNAGKVLSTAVQDLIFWGRSVDHGGRDDGCLPFSSIDKCVGFSIFEHSVSEVLNVPPKNQSISSLASYSTLQYKRTFPQ